MIAKKGKGGKKKRKGTYKGVTTEKETDRKRLRNRKSKFPRTPPKANRKEMGRKKNSKKTTGG